MLTCERLQELFDYNPDIGCFVRKKRSANRTKAGEVAGTVNSKGYVVLKVDGRAYKAHRLAWLYWYGVWPDDQIDHINGLKSDNRISNLRVVNNSENQQNAIKPHRNNKLGVRGVKFDPRPGRVKRYEASIKVNKKKIFLGSFNTIDEAKDAYLSAKIKFHIRGVV